MSTDEHFVMNVPGPACASREDEPFNRQKASVNDSSFLASSEGRLW